METFQEGAVICIHTLACDYDEFEWKVISITPHTKIHFSHSSGCGEERDISVGTYLMVWSVYWRMILWIVKQLHVVNAPLCEFSAIVLEHDSCESKSTLTLFTIKPSYFGLRNLILCQMVLGVRERVSVATAVSFRCKSMKWNLHAKPHNSLTTFEDFLFQRALPKNLSHFMLLEELLLRWNWNRFLRIQGINWGIFGTAQWLCAHLQ